MRASHGVQVLAVLRGVKPPIEERPTFRDVAGTAPVQKRVVILAFGRALRACDPQLRTDARGPHARGRRRDKAIQNLLGLERRQRPHLIEVDEIALETVAAAFGHAARPQRAAVDERQRHAAVAHARVPVDQRRQRGAHHAFNQLAKLFVAILTGLREIPHLTVGSKQRVTHLLGLAYRRLARLALNGHYHAVVVVRSRFRVQLTGHVRYLALPRDQRLTQSGGDARHLAAVRLTRRVARGRVARRCRPHCAMSLSSCARSPAFAEVSDGWRRSMVSL